MADKLTTVAQAICRSGKFECGQGTCALLCMDQLSSPRDGVHGCHHAVRIHGDLAGKILAALDALPAKPDSNLLRVARNLLALAETKWGNTNEDASEIFSESRQVIDRAALGSAS